MLISWRPQHEVHPDYARSPDFLAIDRGRVIGRMFQMTHEGNAGRWFWTVLASGSGVLIDPLCGVEDQQGGAARCVAEAYEEISINPASLRSHEEALSAPWGSR